MIGIQLWKCFVGFNSPIAMEETAKLIYQMFQKKLVLRRKKDCRLFPGCYQEKPTHFNARDISM